MAPFPVLHTTNSGCLGVCGIYKNKSAVAVTPGAVSLCQLVDQAHTSGRTVKANQRKTMDSYFER